MYGTADDSTSEKCNKSYKDFYFHSLQISIEHKRTCFSLSLINFVLSNQVEEFITSILKLHFNLNEKFFSKCDSLKRTRIFDTHNAKKINFDRLCQMRI